MKIKKQLNKIERRLWLLENPRLFQDNEIVRYYPVLFHTTEIDEVESFLIKILFEYNIKHMKINGENYFERIYKCEPINGLTEVDESDCIKIDNNNENIPK